MTDYYDGFKEGYKTRKVDLFLAGFFVGIVTFPIIYIISIIWSQT